MLGVPLNKAEKKDRKESRHRKQPPFLSGMPRQSSLLKIELTEPIERDVAEEALDLNDTLPDRPYWKDRQGLIVNSSVVLLPSAALDTPP